MINIGIVGCGRISGKHCEAISKVENCKLVAICDLDGDKAKELASKFGCEPYTNYEDIEKDFKDKKLHPMDLKQSLIREINNLLGPIRDKMKGKEDLAKKAYPNPA